MATYALLSVEDHSRCRLLQFRLGAHFLDLRHLLSELRGEDFHSFLLLERQLLPALVRGWVGLWYPL